MLKVDQEALKGGEEALNDDGKPLMGEGAALKVAVKRPRRCDKGWRENEEVLEGDREVLKGNGEVMKGNEMHKGRQKISVL